MKDNLSRVVAFFATLDLSEEDLHCLVTELKSLTPEEINARVSALRHVGQAHLFDEATSKSSEKKYLAQPRDASVGERVERLLRAEAGLTTAQAVEKLSLRLADLGLVAREDVPALSRKSLRDWVGRLAQRVPPKDILRCATILRNEHVHRPIRDWTLSRAEK